VLDLSLVTSEYVRNIHPCKGCVCSAMPLSHWPCTFYPNHALAQAEDWVAAIYERGAAAHVVIILAPTYWHQSPSPLKLMIDRMVCADGGNPDPTTTHGKKVAEAKLIEQRGWDCPKYLAGRAYGVVVRGDVAGVEVHRRNLCDWLDADKAVQEETRNVARSVVQAVKELRAGRLRQPDSHVKGPRTK
jgi:hypothetical protein